MTHLDQKHTYLYFYAFMLWGVWGVGYRVWASLPGRCKHNWRDLSVLAGWDSSAGAGTGSNPNISSHIFVFNHSKVIIKVIKETEKTEQLFPGGMACSLVWTACCFITWRSSRRSHDWNPPKMVSFNSAQLFFWERYRCFSEWKHEKPLEGSS